MTKKSLAYQTGRTDAKNGTVAKYFWNESDQAYYHRQWAHQGPCFDQIQADNYIQGYEDQINGI